jgi:lysophospholipase L1-like esterase
MEKLRQLETWQIVLILAGLGLAGLGLGADTIGLSAVGLSTGQILLVILGAGLMGAGLVGRALPRFYSGAGLILLNTLLLVLLTELFFGFVARFALRSKDENIPRTGYSYIYLRLDYYQRQPWGQAFWDEADQFNRLVFHPFLVASTPPFTGEFINVGADGLRLTPNTACDDPAAYEIWFFGGSTMFGFGVPDAMTIPAYFQDAWEVRRPLCVVNFSVPGYVTQQSLAHLSLALQARPAPDFVLFYQGVNDTYAAYLNGRPQTLSINEDELAARLEGRTLLADSPWWQDLRDASYTYRVLARFWPRDPANDIFIEEENRLTYDKRGVETQALADELAAYTRRLYTQLEIWAVAYEFDFLYAWQPVVLVGQKPLTAEEQTFIATSAESMKTFYRAAYSAVTTHNADLENFVSLVDIFDQTADFIYIDRLHLAPPGNQRVAQALYDHLKERLPQ